MTLPLAISALAFLGLLAFLGMDKLGLGFSSQGLVRQSIRDMAAAQRSSQDRAQRDQVVDEDSRVEPGSAKEIEVTTNDYASSLQKRLKYAQLSGFHPYVFALVMLGISTSAFVLVSSYFGWMFQILALCTGPMLVNFFINRRISQRFKAFDRDYPQFLLSLVGMLKTGLNPIQALEAAASNLEERSLVKIEVDLMLERLRLGVSEERSIGSFGEDIDHAEIELFVQALLLSRRVGGNLSDTLDRLARQVRKRQYFRQSAVGAVGLQRGSITFILGILSMLELYLYWVWPASVVETWQDPTVREYAQMAVGMIIIGVFWVRQVTKIRV